MTSEAKALAAAIRPAIGWIREQIRRDAANRYSLLADWSLPACRCSWWPDSIPVWESDLFRIERVAPGIVAVTVRAYESTAERNVCDGATMSPDTPAGVLPAAIFHDPWYFRESDEEPRQYELVARACGVSARKAKRFGDVLFYAIGTAAGGSRALLRCYYLGIRIGTPLYHLLKPFLAVAVAAGLLAGGCTGCIGPGDDGTFIDPGLYVPPLVEKVQ